MIEAPRLPELPSRPFLYEGSEGPYWTRIPRAEAARGFALPDGVVLLRADDIRAVLRDPRFVQWSLWAIERNPTVDRGFVARRQQQLPSMEGADHVRLRRLTGRAMSARVMEDYRARMRSIMSGLAADAPSSCEANAVLCRPYPGLVMSALMGAPSRDAGFFAEIAEAWTSWLAGNPSAAPRSLGAHERLEAYLAPLIKERRASAGATDVLSRLAHAEESGERLTDPEVLHMASGFVAGGIESTRQTLANALYLFALHPEQWRLLAETPALAEQAVEEVLRFLPPFAMLSRISREDAQVNGLAIPAQTKLYLSLVSAGHDARVHADPKRFDITRAPAPSQIAFGPGRHACIGMYLARAQLQEALGVLPQVIERLDLEGEPQWRPLSEPVQGVSRLPLRLTIRRGAGAAAAAPAPRAR
jgi:cytochrome P450